MQEEMTQMIAVPLWEHTCYSFEIGKPSLGMWSALVYDGAIEGDHGSALEIDFYDVSIFLKVSR